MSTGRRRGVIEGNTVRKIQPSQRPYIEQHPQRNVRHHAEKVSYVNILYTIFLAAAAWCVVRQFLRLDKEPNEARRRQERIIVLLYTAAQGVILLLTAEAGFGLVALVLHIGVYFLCVGVMTGWRPGRQKR